MTNYRIPTIYNPEGKCLAQIQGYPCDHGSQRCEQYATNRRTHVNQTEDCNPNHSHGMSKRYAIIAGGYIVATADTSADADRCASAHVANTGERTTVVDGTHTTTTTK